MFGGNLAVGWPAALVARHFMDGYLDRLRKAVQVSETFYATIGRHPAVKVEPIANGTNLRHITLTGVDASAISRRLAARDIQLPANGASKTLTLGVNETWARISASDLVSAFTTALAEPVAERISPRLREVSVGARLRFDRPNKTRGQRLSSNARPRTLPIWKCAPVA